jgi:tetratricopeptide (TPR) repeat protein
MLIISLIVGFFLIKIPEYFTLSRNIISIEYLLKLKKYGQAEELIIESFKINPHKSNLYNLLGRLYLERGDVNLAKKILLGVFQSNKRNYLIAYNLAIAYSMDKDFEEAMRFNKIALNKNNKDIKIIQQRILLYWELNKYKEAINCYNKYFSKFEKNEVISKEISIMILNCAAQIGDLSIYQKILSNIKINHSPDLFYNVLLSASQMRDISTIQKCLKNISELNLAEHYSDKQINVINKLRENENLNSQ